MKKIMVVSYGRADYGLLTPLLKRLKTHPQFQLQLVATGMHLSNLHGKTIDFIRKDGFEVIPVEVTGASDSEHSICVSVATGMHAFSHLILDKEPDLIVVLGDRYELIPPCVAALIHKIPIAHIHGGEKTTGAFDEQIRHMITKLATFHFPIMDLYGQRIQQMGEDPSKIFVVGSLGVENIKSMDLMTKEEISSYTGVDFHQDIGLLTYHPVTLESSLAPKKQMTELMEAISETDFTYILTAPNADTAGNQIREVMDAYVQRNPKKFHFVENLGQVGYLSTLKHARFMIGNSSSGILESPSFRLPTINIGERQKGRHQARNVLNCRCEKALILESIDKAVSRSFQDSLAGLVSPFGDGNASLKMVQALEDIDFERVEEFLKKDFFDLPMSLLQG